MAETPARTTARPRRRRPLLRWLLRASLLALILGLSWFFASLHDWREHDRILPGDPYAGCGERAPAALPATVRVGLYEEFPDPWRFDKLQELDFPIDLAIAVPSRDSFLEKRQAIVERFPQVREVYFWPLLTQEEGYYTSPWASAEALRRVAEEARDLPVLWDLEMPNSRKELPLSSIPDWWGSRSFIADWLSSREQPVHIWRTDTHMGFDSTFLELLGMHYDPLDYPAVRLHLELYNPGFGTLSEQRFQQIVRCGVERYGERFIPSLGVLNDGEGPPEVFITPEALRRNLRLVREAGVSEVWLFGANGLGREYLQLLHEILPLESLQK